MLVYRRRALLFLFFCLNTFSYGQSTPAIIKQVNFETGLDDIVAGSAQNKFVMRSHDHFTLIDQVSKLQLGTLSPEIGMLVNHDPKVCMLKDGGFLIVTANSILHADVFKNTMDTLYKTNVFNELIEQAVLFGNDMNKLLINTKIYPLDKKGVCHISYTDAKNTMHCDSTTNCRFYLLDINSKRILDSVRTTHFITSVSKEQHNDKIIAGTFKGDVVEVDVNLVCRFVFSPFKRPVHDIIILGDNIISVANLSADYIGEVGDDVLYITNIETKLTKQIQLTKQASRDNDGMKLGPSAQVFRLFSLPQENIVLVNYGFNGLLSLNTITFDTVSYNIPYNTVKFYCLNKDGSQLIGAVADKNNIFNSAGKLMLFDLNKKKVQPVFRQYAESKKFRLMRRVADDAGNYHILCLKDYAYGNDTMVIFSSNNTEPTYIECKYCQFNLNEKNDLLIKKNEQYVIGTMQWSKLNRPFYSLSLSKIDSNVYVPLFDNVQSKNSVISEPDNVARTSKGEYIIAYEDQLYIVDATGKILFSLKSFKRDIFLKTYYELSYSEKYLRVCYEKDNATIVDIWDWRNNKKVFSCNTVYKKSTLAQACFDRMKDVFWYYLLPIGDGVGSVYKVDLSASAPKAELVYKDPPFLTFETDIANDRIAYYGDNIISLRSLSDNKELYHIYPYSSYINIEKGANGFSFVAEKELYTITDDLKYLYFTCFDGDKPVEIVNDQYYRANKEAINNIAFTINGNGYLPGDLDLYFNRPDSVILISGSKNEVYNASIAGAVKKRYANTKAPADINALLAEQPTCAITNKANITEVLNTDTVTLQIHAQAKNGREIKSISFLANGVPATIRACHSNDVSTSYTIQLEKGNNALQVFATDQNGINSASETINVFADYAVTPKTYLVVFATNIYNDPNYNLRYCVKDGRDIATAFAQRYQNNISIDTLFNSEVNTANINAIRKKLAAANVNDRVVLFVSGHGVLDKTNTFRYATYDMNFSQVEGFGITNEELENILNGSPARKRILLLDACHSGEMDRNDTLSNVPITTAAVVKVPGSKGSGVMNTNAIGLNNSYELMKELFADVTRKSGIKVISAAAGNSYALESDKWHNGVFTYSLLHALNDREADENKDATISVTELRKYVGKSVEQMTNGQQKPTTRGDNIEFDFDVW